MSDEAPDNKAILDAINALDVKVEKRLDELVKVDTHLTEEVQRIGRKQERQEQDIRDLKSDTSRRFDSEREESKSTMAAIVAHVDKSAEAFRAKAADIDELKEMQVKQTAILERLDKVAANPLVRKVAYAIGVMILMWLASKGVKL
jgi:tetrahydromethanopterin S-methyltransferase subunit G